MGLEGPEVRPLFRLGAPTLQHDLVQEVGAFGRSRHPVTFDDLLVRLLVVQGWGGVGRGGVGVEGGGRREEKEVEVIKDPSHVSFLFKTCRQSESNWGV